MAVRAASHYVWAVSGRQHGTCPVLLRPCRAECAPAPMGTWQGQWWDGVAYPSTTYPWWRLDVACGRCRSDCACTATSVVQLEVPAQGITQVLIDGTELPVSGYAFYDGRTLVRADGGEWPLCQDWSVPVSGVGAWSIEAVYGEPVPDLGQLAVGEVAELIIKHCSGAPDCRLPPGLQSQTRAGTTQVFLTPAELADKGTTGFAWVDRFVEAVNPGRLTTGAKIWNPDDYVKSRRPGGV